MTQAKRQAERQAETKPSTSTSTSTSSTRVEEEDRASAVPGREQGTSLASTLRDLGVFLLAPSTREATAAALEAAGLTDADLLDLAAFVAESEPDGGKRSERKPDGYAYRYHSQLGGTTLRFNNGEEVNGGKPFETVPFYFAPAPAPAQDGKALLRQLRRTAWITGNWVGTHTLLREIDRLLASQPEQPATNASVLTQSAPTADPSSIGEDTGMSRVATASAGEAGSIPAGSHTSPSQPEPATPVLKPETAWLIERREGAVGAVGGKHLAGRSRRACLTATKAENGSVRLMTGCFNGSLDDFAKAVECEHGGNEHGDAYRAAIALIRARFGVAAEVAQ